MYLSPELVGGAAPSVASDCWALGCTLYHALCGRPPVWADSQAEVMKRIVKFDGLDGGEFPEGFDASARGTRRRRDDARRRRAPRRRRRRRATEDFFSGLDVDSLYSQTPPPLKGGIAAPAPQESRGAAERKIILQNPPSAASLPPRRRLERIEVTPANAPFAPTLRASIRASAAAGGGDDGDDALCVPEPPSDDEESLRADGGVRAALRGGARKLHRAEQLAAGFALAPWTRFPLYHRAEREGKRRVSTSTREPRPDGVLEATAVRAAPPCASRVSPPRRWTRRAPPPRRIPSRARRSARTRHRVVVRGPADGARDVLRGLASRPYGEGLADGGADDRRALLARRAGKAGARGGRARRRRRRADRVLWGSYSSIVER